MSVIVHPRRPGQPIMPDKSGTAATAALGLAAAALGMAAAAFALTNRNASHNPCVAPTSQPPDIAGTYSSFLWRDVPSNTTTMIDHTSEGRTWHVAFVATADPWLLTMSRKAPCLEAHEGCASYLVDGVPTLLYSSREIVSCGWAYGGCGYILTCVDGDDIALHRVVPLVVAAGSVIEAENQYTETGSYSIPSPSPSPSLPSPRTFNPHPHPHPQGRFTCSPTVRPT